MIRSDCLHLSIQGFPGRNVSMARMAQAQHTPAVPASTQHCMMLRPRQSPCNSNRTHVREHEPAEPWVQQALGKDTRATCGAGTSTRETQGEAKHISNHLNGVLCGQPKLNWTLGTCAKMFVRLLLPAPTCFAASEEGEQRGWAGPFPLCARAGLALGLSPSPAPRLLFVHCLLPFPCAVFLTKYFP